MKKIIFKNSIFSLLIILLILSFLGVGVKFLFKKEAWITVELWGSGGEWWWNTGAPPYWIANAIEAGDIEYDARGEKIAEVVEIKRYEDYDKKKFVLKARLKVVKNSKTGDVRFQNQLLQIGHPLTLNPAQQSITGNIVWIEGVSDKRKQKEAYLTVKIYKHYPWEAEAINIGDAMTDESGEMIAEIIDKEVDLAEVTVVTDRGEVLARKDPLKVDIILKVKVQVLEIVNQIYFQNSQEIKVANKIYINLVNYNINDAEIISIDSLSEN